ncbi:hypothetical protein ANTQUA_LOCUS10315 [Anthophora quadrimaculata]
MCSKRNRNSTRGTGHAGEEGKKKRKKEEREEERREKKNNYHPLSSCERRERSCQVVLREVERNKRRNRQKGVSECGTSRKGHSINNPLWRARQIQALNEISTAFS